VEAIVPAADNGWKHQVPELVLRDGTRKSLAPLSPQDVNTLAGLFQDFQGTVRGAG